MSRKLNLKMDGKDLAQLTVERPPVHVTKDGDIDDFMDQLPVEVAITVDGVDYFAQMERPEYRRLLRDKGMV